MVNVDIGGKCGKEKYMYTLQIKQFLCHDFHRKDKIEKENTSKK